MKKTIIITLILVTIFTISNVTTLKAIELEITTNGMDMGCETDPAYCLADDGGGSEIERIDPRPDAYVPTNVSEVYALDYVSNIYYGYNTDAFESDYVTLSNGRYVFKALDTYEKDSCSSMGPNHVREGYVLKNASFTSNNNYLGLDNSLTYNGDSHTNYYHDLYYEKFDDDYSKVYEIHDICREYRIMKESYSLENFIIKKTYEDGSTKYEDYYFDISILADHLSSFSTSLSAVDRMAIDSIIQTAAGLSSNWLFSTLLNMSYINPYLAVIFGLIALETGISLAIRSGNLETLSEILDAANASDSFVHVHKEKTSVATWSYTASETQIEELDFLHYDTVYAIYEAPEEFYVYDATYNNLLDVMTETTYQSLFDKLIDAF